MWLFGNILFDGISIYTKQGTGALIDGNRFVTAGSMVYSQDQFNGWAMSSLIWIASQDGRGTLTDDPSSGQMEDTDSVQCKVEQIKVILVMIWDI